MSELHWLIRPFKPRTSIIFLISMAIIYVILGVVFFSMESDRTLGYIILVVFMTNANLWLVGAGIYASIVKKLEEGEQ